jgi:hypothetical protein
METIEYRVRPVVRYVVTKYTSDPELGAGSCRPMGEFDHESYAEEVAWALARKARSERVDQLRTVLCDGQRLVSSSSLPGPEPCGGIGGFESTLAQGLPL